MKKGIPVSFGYIPMGIGYAALAIQAGLSPFQTVTMSFCVYAGAGQIIAVNMLAQGASFISIVLTEFVVNLRYFVMSTCVHNKLDNDSLALGIIASQGTVDEDFAIFSLDNESSIWYYLGLVFFTWVSWILGAAIGVIVLDILPKVVSNSFNISLYALFVAILVPTIKENKSIGLIVLITAVLNCILQLFIANWSLILSTIIGAVIGLYLVDDESLEGCNG